MVAPHDYSEMVIFLRSRTAALITTFYRCDSIASAHSMQSRKHSVTIYRKMMEPSSPFWGTPVASMCDLLLTGSQVLVPSSAATEPH